MGAGRGGAVVLPDRRGGLGFLPESGVGEGELEFAAVLAEEERKVLASEQAELRSEELADSGKRVPKPAGVRGELPGPCVRGGQE